MIPEQAAVLFAVNVKHIARFYEHVVGLQVQAAADDHIVLGKGAFHLTVHGIPARYARHILITRPPCLGRTARSSCRFT
jgi:catechol-2,3-dioxygenase